MINKGIGALVMIPGLEGAMEVCECKEVLSKHQEWNLHLKVFQKGHFSMI